MRKLIPLFALTASCSALTHTERVKVLNPYPLADTRIARLASGAKIQLDGEQWTFKGVEDSLAVLTCGRKLSELPLDSLRGKELILSANKFSGVGCLLGGGLGLLTGGGVGIALFEKTRKDLEQGSENTEGCGTGLAYAIGAAIVLALTLLLGAAIALLAALGGSLCLSGIFGAKKVKALKERAQKLRDALR